MGVVTEKGSSHSDSLIDRSRPRFYISALLPHRQTPGRPGPGPKGTSIMRSSLFGKFTNLICLTATVSPVPQWMALYTVPKAPLPRHSPRRYMAREPILSATYIFSSLSNNFPMTVLRAGLDLRNLSGRGPAPPFRVHCCSSSVYWGSCLAWEPPATAACH